MGVRAIFYVAEATRLPNGVGRVKLQAAAKGPYGHWSKWTPSGELTLNSTNEAAHAWFDERVGKDVALNIDDPTEADLATGDA